MATVEVKVPSNIKISGEHSVVFGGPSLSAAVPPYATATLTDTNSSKLEIVLGDLKISASFDEATLRDLYKDYIRRNALPEKERNPIIAEYINAHQATIGREVLPYATIAGRLLVEQGISPINKRVVIHSDVPIGKG